MVGFASAGVLLAALALLLAERRLSEGPVSLPQIAQLAESRLNAAGGLTFDVGDAVFALGDDRLGSGLRLLDVSATTAEGEPVFGAPEISVRFRLWDLLFGALRPTAIDVAGITLRVRRDASGRLSLAGLGADPRAPAPPRDAGGSEEAGPSDPLPADLTEALDLLGSGRGVLGSLRSATGRDLSLLIQDDVSGRVWVAADATAVVVLSEERQAARLTAQIFPIDEAASPDLPATRVTLEGVRRPEAGGLSLAMTFADALVPRLTEVVPELAALRPIEARASGRLRVEADRDGRPLSLTGELRIGAGRLDGMTEEAAGFQAIELDLGWSATEGALDIARAELRSDAVSAELSGRLAPWAARPAEDGGPGAAPAAYAVTAELSRLELTPEAGFDDVLVFDSGAFSGDLLTEEWRLEVSELRLTSADLTLTGNGALAAAEDGMAVAARLASDGFSTEALLQHWPLGAAPGGRRWLDENLKAGRVTGVDLWVWSQPGEAPEVTLDFGFEGLEATVVRGMPPVIGARGVGRATLERVDLDFEAGGATPPGAGRADLAGSTFSIPDVRAEPPVGVARLRARSTIADAMVLLDQPPLELLSRLDADLGEVSGDAVVTADLTLPLLRNLRIAEVQVSVEAALSDVALTAPGSGVPVASPDLALVGDAQALTLEGPATLEGVPARIAWNERYGADPGRTLRVSARLDGAALDRLGFEALQIREGAVDAALTLEGVRDPVARLEADLQGASLRAPLLSWRKAAGEAGRLSAEAQLLRGGGVDVRRVDLETRGLVVDGALRLDDEGGIVSGAFPRLRLNRMLDIELEMQRSDDGAIEAAIGGRFLHLGRLSRLRRNFVASGPDGSDGAEADPAAATPFSAQVDVRRVIAADGVEMRRVRGEVSRRGGVTRAAVRGAVNGGGPARLRYRQGLDGDAVLTIRSADAGRLLEDLGVTDTAVGGALALRARIPPEGEGDINGVAEVENIRVGGQRALGAVVAEASQQGLEARSVEGGYDFETVTVPFKLDAERLRIDNALAEGPSLGLKMGGDFLRESGDLDFDGVITPAYQLNSLLNNVPLLGELLGGRGEGLFGLNFSVRGSREDPAVSVNPLSALAPGILRRLVQGGEPVDVPPDLFEPDR